VDFQDKNLVMGFLFIHSYLIQAEGIGQSAPASRSGLRAMEAAKSKRNENSYLRNMVKTPILPYVPPDLLNFFTN